MGGLSFKNCMRSKIDLRPEHLRLVQSILQAHVPGREVRAFGSRVSGTAKPTSDLDLCIMGSEAMEAAMLERLIQAFSESSLPYKVDVVEWVKLPPTLRSIVEKQSVIVQQGTL